MQSSSRYLKEEPTKIRLSGYQPSDEDAEITQMVYQRKKDMGDARKKWEIEWMASSERALPRSLRSDGAASSNIYIDPDDLDKYANDMSGWSSLKIPFVHAVIQAALSEMSARSPEPLVVPWKKKYESIARMIERAVKYTWNKGDGDMELLKILTDKLGLGTGVGLELWVSDYREVKDIVGYDPKTGKTEYRVRKQTDYDDCKMQWISPWDAWFDETVKEPAIEKCRDGMYRRLWHVDDFKRAHVNFANAKYVIGSGLPEDKNRFDFYEAEPSYASDIVEDLYYYNRAQDMYVRVANDVLISSSPIPYIHKEIPMSIDRDIVDNNSIYGWGESHLLEDLVQEMEAIRNMRLDNMYIGIHKTFFIDRSASLDEEDLWVAPGRGITLETGGRSMKDVVMPFEYSDIKASAYNEEDRLVQDAIRTTGIDPNLQSSNQGTTATETAIQRETAIRRLAIKLRYTERVFLKRIFRQRVANIKQFYSQKKISLIADEDDLMEAQAIIAQIMLEGEYQQEARDYFEKNYIVEGDEIYKVDKRNIRLKNDDGQMEFYEVDPDTIRPDMEFEVDVVQGASMPISKPIQQEKYKDYVTTMMTMFGEAGILNMRTLAKNYAKLHDDNPGDILMPEMGMPGMNPLGQMGMGQTQTGAQMSPQDQSIGQAPINPNEVQPGIAGGATADSYLTSGTGTGI